MWGDPGLRMRGVLCTQDPRDALCELARPTAGPSCSKVLVQSLQDRIHIALFAKELSIVEVPYIKEVDPLQGQLGTRTLDCIQYDSTGLETTQWIALLDPPGNLEELPTRQVDPRGG